MRGASPVLRVSSGVARIRPPTLPEQMGAISHSLRTDALTQCMRLTDFKLHHPVLTDAHLISALRPAHSACDDSMSGAALVPSPSHHVRHWRTSYRERMHMHLELRSTRASHRHCTTTAVHVPASVHSDLSFISPLHHVFEVEVDSVRRVGDLWSEFEAS